jgi:polysaccharide export outer membrane protein
LPFPVAIGNLMVRGREFFRKFAVIGGFPGSERRTMNRHFYNSFAFAALASACCAVAWGQSPAPATSDAPAAAVSAGAPADPSAGSPAVPRTNPELKPNPLEEMRKFEPAADEEYRLGRGDEITIDFAGRSDLLAKLVVGPDGRISLPLAGEIMLNGLSRAEAAKSIEDGLAPYYSNLSVQVTVTKYTANRVMLLGAVDHPGPMLFDGVPTLLEAITRGGLPTAGPEKRPQIPDQCAIYRGSDKVLWVQLRSLIDSGNPMADLRLRRDDVVYVPDPAARFVSVLGEVQHPGAVPLTAGTTLASVLATAGGITDKAGARPHIQIVDPVGGTTRTIAFNDMLNPAKNLEVTLKPGEIIYVPQTGFSRVSYYLERLNPMTQMAMVMSYAGVL